MLNKKLSIGILLLNSKEYYQNLLKKYAQYINDIYIGPLQDYSFDGNRQWTATDATRQLKERYTSVEAYHKDLLTIIDYARSLGIKVNFTINLVGLKKLLYLTDSFIEELQPDIICTRSEYLDHYKSIYYCNNYTRTWCEQGVPLDPRFNGYVLKNSSIWSTQFITTNLEYRIMLNRACSELCNGCATSKRCNKDKQGTLTLTYLSKYPNILNYIARYAFFERDLTLLETQYPNIRFIYKICDRFEYENTSSIIDTQNQYLDIMLNNNYKGLLQADANIINMFLMCSGLNNNKLKTILHTYTEQDFIMAKTQLWESLSSNFKY